MYSLVRTLIFCVLFAIGFGSMSVAFLAPEFDVYYNNLRYKEYIDYQIKILEDKRIIYNDKLSLLYGDPEIKYRLGRSIFGVEPKKSDTVFPEPGKELKDESLNAVQDVVGRPLVLTAKPEWVKLINVKQNNDVLLYGGIILVVLSMFFFVDPAKKGTVKVAETADEYSDEQEFDEEPEDDFKENDEAYNDDEFDELEDKS